MRDLRALLNGGIGEGMTHYSDLFDRNKQGASGEAAAPVPRS